jgi:hypothetical protein
MPGVCNGPSQAVLCPHGADFFVRRKIAALGFGKRSVDVGGFFRRQFVRRLLDARKLEKHPRKIVLHIVRQHADSLYGLLKQCGHPQNIMLSAALWKPPEARGGPHGFPVAIAMAAATNGNGSDTAARNQTKRAGMKGISHSRSR